MNIQKISSLLFFTLMAGCSNPSQEKNSSIDQSLVCKVESWDAESTKKRCASGQKIVFLPETWGNKQLPVIFSAVNCDHRFEIVITDGGVSCIYLPIK